MNCHHNNEQPYLLTQGLQWRPIEIQYVSLVLHQNSFMFSQILIPVGVYLAWCRTLIAWCSTHMKLDWADFLRPSQTCCPSNENLKEAVERNRLRSLKSPHEPNSNQMFPILPLVLLTSSDVFVYLLKRQCFICLRTNLDLLPCKVTLLKMQCGLSRGWKECIVSGITSVYDWQAITNSIEQLCSTSYNYVPVAFPLLGHICSTMSTL